MIQFSVGYGAHEHFEDAIETYAGRICEVYCAPPFVASSAGIREIPYDQQYALSLHRFLDVAREREIPVNLLLDPLCLGDDYAAEARGDEILALLRTYVDLYGVSSVTVSSVPDGELIKNRLPQIAVHVSEAMLIKHPEQARRVAQFAEVVTLDRDLNRDLDGVRRAQEAAGKPVQLVANMACVYRCVAKVHLLNAISHFPDLMARGGAYCAERFEKDPALLLKSTMILPCDVGRYEGLVGRMKLDSLFWDTERLERLLAAYTSGRCPENLWEIAGGGAGTFFGSALSRGAAPLLESRRIPEGFSEKTAACGRLCRECGYCDRIVGELGEEDPVARAVRTALR